MLSKVDFLQIMRLFSFVRQMNLLNSAFSNCILSYIVENKIFYHVTSLSRKQFTFGSFWIIFNFFWNNLLITNWFFFEIKSFHYWQVFSMLFLSKQQSYQFLFIVDFIWDILSRNNFYFNRKFLLTSCSKTILLQLYSVLCLIGNTQRYCVRFGVRHHVISLRVRSIRNTRCLLTLILVFLVVSRKWLNFK